MMKLETQLQALLTQANLELSADVQSKMLQFLELLQKWNKAYNLTAITDLSEMLTVHVMDSLSILPYVMGEQIVDVGTGAGFPGIPLALVLPQQQFTLVESSRKKCQFLLQAVLVLGLKNVRVVQERAEVYQPAERFDCVITRAFSNLSDMLAKTVHLVKEDGLFLAMKGMQPTEEIAVLPAGFEVVAVYALQVAGLTAQRHLVCLRKK
jgi:16S rRNA (guanine527-N7)-methyltransferase